MVSILQLLDTIQALPGDRYALPAETQQVLARHLSDHGFRLDEIACYSQLIEILRVCNAADFERLVQKPAPTPAHRFLWNRLRKLGR